MEFWRGEAYTAYVDYLESTGGFYYEVKAANPSASSSSSRLIRPASPFFVFFTAMGRRTGTHDGGLPLPSKRQDPLFR